MNFYLETLARALPTRLVGCVMETTGGTAAVADFPAPVGAVVEIERSSGGHVRAEVIGFRNQRTLVFPYENMTGIRRGAQVQLVSTIRQLRVGDELLGRVINAHGHCVDGRPQPMLSNRTVVERVRPCLPSVHASIRRLPPASARLMGCCNAAAVNVWGCLPGPASAKVCCSAC